MDPASRQRFARADDDAGPRGVQFDDKQRCAGAEAAKPQAAPLANRVMDDARMASEHPAINMHDVARHRRARRQAFDEIAVSAGWHEANILAVGFIGDRQAKPAGEGADLGFFHIAERKPQQLELRLGRREQEIALIAGKVIRAVERTIARSFKPGRHVMAGRQDIGAEVLRRFKQIGEFDFAIAGNARYGRLPRRITLRERRDDLALEPLLVVEHIMRDAEPGGGKTRIVNILSGATGSFAVNRRAMVVKLQRHADDVVALLLEQERPRPRSRPRPTSRRPPAFAPRAY